VRGDNTIEIASEKPLLDWLGGGHNGGDLHFGNDGMLYISTGDATDTAPPDRLGTGQDISDLLSSILRIDVDHEGNDASGRPLPYSIPTDNPFVHTPKARPEVWAYGFRNPWRMGFDRPTGDLWVGDVGWELHEMVYRVTRGGNYGWSVMEGPQVVNPDGKRGPTPISPPAISFPHTEAASITGGYVYRGKRLKELEGSYICGDWVTRKIWESRFEGGKLVRHRELAQTGQQIIAFGQGHDQELYFLDYREAGGIYRLVPNEATAYDPSRFPCKLSETGLFQSTAKHLPAPGVYPFQINSERFADQAQATRLVAFPGNSSARFYDRAIPIPETFYSGQVFLPAGGVLAKT
jgi:glucose/arabinose dehydrogenase